MYYSSIGVLALLVLLIIHYDILKSSDKTEKPQSWRSYKFFILSIMIFYIADILWGLFYTLKIRPLMYIDTNLFFITMMLSVFLWTRYVAAYLNENNLFSKLLKYAGIAIFIYEIIILIINFFIPIVFEFDKDGLYLTYKARFINLAIQIVLFILTTVYMAIVTYKSNKKEKMRHHTVSFFGFVMIVFIILQAKYPFMPLYSIGLMLGTCLIHTFVVEDEKEEKRKLLENLIKKEQMQEQEIVFARYMAYIDPLTGVKNKASYIDEVGLIEQKIADEQIENFGVVVFDLNGLKIINDTKGHEAGDEYIKVACNMICQHFKHSPVFRIGGDEFVAILKGEDYSNHKQLLLQFTDLILSEKEKDGIIIASGYSDFHAGKDDSFMRVFERADKNMYKSKKQLKDK